MLQPASFEVLELQDTNGSLPVSHLLQNRHEFTQYWGVCHVGVSATAGGA